MNNRKSIDRIKKKAGFIVCLFLLFTYSAFAQDWKFSPSVADAYKAAIRLDFSSADVLNSNSPEELYVTSFSKTLNILLNENRQELEKFEELSHQLLEKNDERLAAINAFVEAELHLQRAFVYLKFREDTKAVFSLRRCFKITSDAVDKYPDFIPLKKTWGLLNVIMGAVPEKYTWVTNLLGMGGSVEQGLLYLQTCARSGSSVAMEAALLQALSYAFILQQPGVGSITLDSLLMTEPANQLLVFLAGSLAIKSSESDKALNYFVTVKGDQLRLDYIAYLHGEALLHSGDYQEAIKMYHQFLHHYKGENYVKDAYFKTGLCHFLLGDSATSQTRFLQAQQIEAAITEADKYAITALKEIDFLQPQLLKARFYTDGGYYAKADEILSEITPTDIPTVRLQAEYYYRKARLKHKAGQPAAAELFYIQTIEMCGSEPWYFAPNACLQMGYICRERGQSKKAKNYFQKALTYKAHAYKNSIDSKAKTALNQMAAR